eukprot:TRINITY_DN21399_c0_g1_i1.p1 TRINITY_DN21399_c0_g1~~TRINITY_DN21399_c0_g1_i1.p1  ORF type:complete len:187 (+),score=53.69 TRINITY_DN21399_c0_g1_i1:356-916(+)
MKCDARFADLDETQRVEWEKVVAYLAAHGISFAHVQGASSRRRDCLLQDVFGDDIKGAMVAETVWKQKTGITDHDGAKQIAELKRRVKALESRLRVPVGAALYYAPADGPSLGSGHDQHKVSSSGTKGEGSSEVSAARHADPALPEELPQRMDAARLKAAAIQDVLSKEPGAGRIVEWLQDVSPTQ